MESVSELEQSSEGGARKITACRAIRRSANEAVYSNSLSINRPSDLGACCRIGTRIGTMFLNFRCLKAYENSVMRLVV